MFDSNPHADVASRSDLAWSTRGATRMRIQSVPANRRKSCDYCGLRKRRCDGHTPCSRCTKKGLPCVYSRRRLPASGRFCGGASGKDNGDEDRVLAGDLLLARGQALKRCRMSASPATGLVGMQENALLSDYFNCLGIMPITGQSTVREAMVNIMTSGSAMPQQWQQQQSVLENRYLQPLQGDENHHHHHSNGGGLGVDSATPSMKARAAGAGSRTSGGAEGASGTTVGAFAADASVCNFWCAVTVGGLLQGRPVEAVAGYIWRAKAALDCCSDTPTVSVARAWVEMAYLYCFAGDSGNFFHYLQLADTFLRGTNVEAEAWREQWPADLVASVRYVGALRMFAGGYTDAALLESFCNDPQPVSRPQIGEIATENDISVFVMDAYRRSGQAFFTDMFLRLSEVPDGDGNGDGDTKADTTADTKADVDAKIDDSLDSAAAGSTKCRCYGHEVKLSVGGDLVRNGVWGQSPMDPNVPGGKMRETMRELIPVYERLEDAVERPRLRKSIGGLLINTALSFSKALRQDLDGAVERLSRCVDVLVDYPGLFRFVVGLHNAHILAMMLASMDAVDVYDRLREAYNPVRPQGSQPMPPLPLEEGQRVNDEHNRICDHIYCRSVGQLILKRNTAPPFLTETRGGNHHAPVDGNSQYGGDDNNPSDHGSTGERSTRGCARFATDPGGMKAGPGGKRCPRMEGVRATPSRIPCDGVRSGDDELDAAAVALVANVEDELQQELELLERRDGVDEETGLRWSTVGMSRAVLASVTGGPAESATSGPIPGAAIDSTVGLQLDSAGLDLSEDTTVDALSDVLMDASDATTDALDTTEDVDVVAEMLIGVPVDESSRGVRQIEGGGDVLSGPLVGWADEEEFHRRSKDDALGAADWLFLADVMSSEHAQEGVL